MPIAEVKGPWKAPLRSSIPPFLTGFGLAEGPEAGLPARVAMASDYAPAGGSPDDAGAAHSTDTRHSHGAPPTLPATKSRSTGARWRRPGCSVRGRVVSHVTSPACRAAPTAPGTRRRESRGPASGATAPLRRVLAGPPTPARSPQSVPATNRPGGRETKGRGGVGRPRGCRAGSRRVGVQAALGRREIAAPQAGWTVLESWRSAECAGPGCGPSGPPAQALAAHGV